MIPLVGLEIGAPYVVRLASSADLAFYVTSGCETATGPSAAQCLLFEDATRTESEIGRFVAKESTAYVVVDYWESQGPASTDFTLDVYPEACTTAQQCQDAQTPACFEGQCVQCVTSFECTSAGSPCAARPRRARPARARARATTRPSPTMTAPPAPRRSSSTALERPR